MAWLEISISTVSGGIARATELLTAGGFEDLVLEDQAEFESFLEENRAYWDYIDESLQQKLLMWLKWKLPAQLLKKFPLKTPAHFLRQISTQP